MASINSKSSQRCRILKIMLSIGMVILFVISIIVYVLEQSDSEPLGIGYKITSEGNFDVNNKRLCHVADPLDPNDAVNLETLRSHIKSELQEIFSQIDRLSSRSFSIEPNPQAKDKNMIPPPYFKHDHYLF